MLRSPPPLLSHLAICHLPTVGLEMGNVTCFRSVWLLRSFNTWHTHPLPRSASLPCLHRLVAVTSVSNSCFYRIFLFSSSPYKTKPNQTKHTHTERGYSGRSRQRQIYSHRRNSRRTCCALTVIVTKTEQWSKTFRRWHSYGYGGDCGIRAGERGDAGDAWREVREGACVGVLRSAESLGDERHGAGERFVWSTNERRLLQVFIVILHVCVCKVFSLG